jgi:hypothetical protein
MYNYMLFFGVLAQLAERQFRNLEFTGSTLVRSTKWQDQNTLSYYFLWLFFYIQLKFKMVFIFCFPQVIII